MINTYKYVRNDLHVLKFRNRMRSRNRKRRKANSICDDVSKKNDK